jgi:REP element-mobilizing transposase RayT
MNRKVPFVQDEYYHVYNRGVDKRVIFSDAIDYKRFVLLLKILNTPENVVVRDLFKTKTYNEIMSGKMEDAIVAIGAYCLMPNHFHILITPLVKNGVEKYMQKLQTAYTMYFNQRNERSGSLFQGTFKSQHLDTDKYLKYMYSYIHLNPAKLKDKSWKEKGPRDFRSLKEFVFNYKYSSIGEYVGDNFIISNPTPFPNYIENYKSREEYFETMVDDWLKYQNTEV